MKRDKQSESLLCYQEEIIVLTLEEANALRRVSKADPWADQGDEAEGYGNIYPAKYWGDHDEDDLTIPEGVKGKCRLGWWIDGVITDQVLHQLQDTLGQQRFWRAWPNSDFALVLPDIAYSSPPDDPILEQLALRLSLEEEEPALFDFVSVAHIEYGTEIEARTWEKAESKSERIYENTDWANYEVESHDPYWKPLNAAAKRLLDQQESKENLQRLRDLQTKLAARSAEIRSPAWSSLGNLEERALLLLQQAIAEFHRITERLAKMGRNSRSARSFVEECKCIEARIRVLGSVLDLPSLHLEWALAIIEDHYCPASQLPSENYQQLMAWFTSPQPHSLPDLSLPARIR